LKSINQIFTSNKHLIDEPEVKELIEYCKELEGQVMESIQNKSWSMEDKLAEVVRDIYSSCNEIDKQAENHDRWPHDFKKPAYENIVTHLKSYLTKFASDNNFRL